jgi:hypothetical protein
MSSRNLCWLSTYPDPVTLVNNTAHQSKAATVRVVPGVAGQHDETTGLPAVYRGMVAVAAAPQQPRAGKDPAGKKLAKRINSAKLIFLKVTIMHSFTSSVGVRGVPDPPLWPAEPPRRRFAEAAAFGTTRLCASTPGKL